MIRKRDRKITSKTARSMCTWSHYTFRQRLLDKAQLHPWCKVSICDEAYTSKTCGQCGALHQKLGGNKTFCCPAADCGDRADRDGPPLRATFCCATSPSTDNIRCC